MIKLGDRCRLVPRAAALVEHGKTRRTVGCQPFSCGGASWYGAAAMRPVAPLPHSISDRPERRLLPVASAIRA